MPGVTGAHEALPAGLSTWVATRGGRLVLAAARAKLEAGHTGDRATVAAELDPDARRDAGRLLGIEWQLSGKNATLGQLRTALAREGVDLTDVLVAAGGPLADRRAQASAAAAQRATFDAGVRGQLIGAGMAERAVDVALARRWLGPRDTMAGVAEHVAAVLRTLGAGPGSGVLLATLATDLFADPHALDRDTAAGRATVRCLAASRAAVNGASVDQVVAAAKAAASSAAQWRLAWAAAGVACDEVSSTVLALNVPLPGPGPGAALLRAAAGEPTWVTSRALRSARPVAGALAGVVVRVCENPAIVETAADRLRAECPPLVCTYGRPSAAAWTLLDALVGAGAQLVVTADRDPAGVSICAALMARFPTARPWLPDAVGTFEEERLEALLQDLASDP